MSRLHRRLIVLALVCTAASFVRVSALPAADLSSPDRAIEGIWRYDARHSDDPAKVLPQGGPGGRMGGPPAGGPPMGGGRGPGGGPGGHGGPGGMGGPPPGDRPGGARAGEGGPGEAGGEPGEPRHDPMMRLAHPAEQVVVFVLTDQLEITEDDRPPLTYSIKDSLEAHSREIESVTGTARWKGAVLVTRSDLGPRAALSETYELSPDGNTLTIRSRSEGAPVGTPAIALKRVYRRYDGE